jgi:hypothetical protein
MHRPVCDAVGEYSLGQPGERRGDAGDIMTNDDPPGEEELDRLRARLAEIQLERAEVLHRPWLDLNDEYAQENDSDALHALAKEEAGIRKALGLPPGDWDPGNWPEWGGWLLLTLLAVGIPLLAWMTRPG